MSFTLVDDGIKTNGLPGIQRYHTIIGHGSGLEDDTYGGKIRPSDVGRDLFERHDAGHWVLYWDVSLYAERRYYQGLAEGRKTDDAPKPSEPAHRDHERLLNELYHDRARLEKVIKNTVESFKAMLPIIEDAGLAGVLTDEHRSCFDTFIGKMAGFIDDHS